ncbi:MAG: flagellar biosynthetic protein FliR [Actinomycetota bacterium]|nr:flagellar biosynthetic protein FliR [Actinomycetota bacterium]
MDLELATPTLLGFLLGTLRGVAWLLVVPPFSGRTIPTPVKIVLAVTLALPVTPKLAVAAPDMTLPDVVASAVLQILAGVSLGFVTYLLFAAVQAAGDLIDLFGGFQLAQGFDPMSNSQNSVFGKLHHLLAVTLLFVLDGHLLVIRGFLKSYETVPLDASIPMGRFAEILVTGLGSFFLAALQIAGPLVGVLFLVDVGLGLLTRIAPALNPFSLGFPAKILATLLLVGVTIPLLPDALESVVDLGLRAVASAARPAVTTAAEE